jgi:small-conductance mechanosensitive channel
MMQASGAFRGSEVPGGAVSVHRTDSRPHFAPRVAIRALVAAWLAVGAWSGLAAQPAETKEPSAGDATAAEPPPPEVQAIALSDVPRQAEATILRLREIEADLAPDARVLELTDRLGTNDEELDALRARTDAAIARRTSLRNLQDLRQQWFLAKARVDNWESHLKKRSRLLDDDRKELGEMRERWVRTRDSPDPGEVPPPVVERIEGLLGRVEEVEAALLDRVEVVLTLQNHLSGQRLEINEGISALDEASEETRQDLFLPDAAPLWTELLSPTADDRIGAQLAESWERDRAALAEFFDSYRENIKAHLLLFIALLLLIVLLRRRAIEWAAEDETLEFSVHALKHPLSATTVLALILTYFIYPRAPIVVYELNALVMMLPVLRLLPAMVYAPMRRPLYGLIALLVFDHVHQLAIDGSLLQRLLLLVLTVATLAGQIWVLRPGGPASKTPGGRWWTFAQRVAHLAYVTLGGSLVANLLGNVALARLLADGTMASARFALILFAGALVLDGAVVVALRTALAQSLNAVRRHGDLLKSRGRGIVHAVAMGLWIWALLAVFQVDEIVFNELTLLFNRVWRLGTIEISLSGVIAFFVTVYIAFQLSRFIRFLLEEDVLPRLTLPRGVPGAVSSLTHYVILALGVILAMGASGIELSKFTVIAGAFGVGIGFGLQTVVNNFVSGLILMFERPVQVGDTIEIGPLIGIVRRIGIRASVVRTFEGAEVIVPNGDLIAGQVVNWTLSDRTRRVHVRLGVAYGTDPRQVLELIVEVARSHADVLDYPEPLALFLGFGESSLDFELRFWTSNFDNWRKIESEVTVALHDAVVAAGIEIPFPQRDLHLRSVDPVAGKTINESRNP